MPDMIATKRLKYGTRRLLPGDPFSARHDRDAKLLIGIGKARYATREMVATDEPAITIPEINLSPDAVEAIKSISKTCEDTVAGLSEVVRNSPIPQIVDDIAALRSAYMEKFDKRPFNGWSAEILREKLAAE
jgi:hypothetical protein